MSEELENDWVICSPWSAERLTQLAGNRTGACSECRERVVIAREGQAVLAQRPLTGRAICIPCARKRFPDVVPLPVPGALERAAREGYNLSPHTKAAVKSTPLKDWPEWMGR